MAARFPLFTDIDVDGPLIKGLIRKGWDVVRAVDVLPGDSVDEILFEYAVKRKRVFVTNDKLIHRIATRWMKEERPFHGMVYWRDGPLPLPNPIHHTEMNPELAGMLPHSRNH